MIVSRRNMALLAVVVTLFMAVFCGFGPSVKEASDGDFLFLFQIGPNVWATEAMYALSWNSFGIFDRDFIQMSFGYTMDRVTADLFYMVVLAAVYRIIAYGLMIGLHRDKQK